MDDELPVIQTQAGPIFHLVICPARQLGTIVESGRVTAHPSTANGLSAFPESIDEKLSYAEHLLCIADLHYDRRDLTRCGEALKAAMFISFENPAVLNAVGVFNVSTLNAGAAVPYFTQAIALGNNSFALWNLAYCFSLTNRYREGLLLINNYIEHSRAAHALFLKGYILFSLGLIPAAIAHLEEGLHKQHQNVDVTVMLLKLLRENKALAKAYTIATNAPASFDTDFRFVREKLLLLSELNILTDAEQYIVRISTSFSGNIRVLKALISAIFATGELPKWRKLFLAALEKYPYDRTLRRYACVVLFEQGKFRKAFEYYERRTIPRRPLPTADILPLPLWHGVRHSNKRILVHAEQGLGDQIMFTRFLKVFSKGQAIVVVDKRLIPILKRSFPHISYLTGQSYTAALHQLNKKRADYQISIGSLGRFFPEILSERGICPYLLPKRTLVDTLRKRYHSKANGRVLVGLSWYSKNPKLHSLKNPEILNWRSILNVKNAFFVNLQYGSENAHMETLAAECHTEVYCDPSINQLINMEGYLAQIAALDVVVTISNTCLHVAGALGKKTLFLRPRGLTFISLITKGRRLLWYPSVEVFTRGTSWSTTFQSAASRLSQITGAGVREWSPEIVRRRRTLP